MAFIEEEGEELFGLRDPQEAVNLNELSASEEEYDDDDAGDHTTGRPPSGAQGDQGDAHDAAPDPDAAKVVKPKRVIKNPQPKLDVARLCGPRGIGVIQKFLSDAPYRGKGHETEDLGLLLKKLQHWAHRLYPKLPFLDTITHIEKLGNKKPLQVNIKRLRLDMYETPEEGTVDGMVVDAAELPGGDDAPPDDEQPDVFDELLRQSGAGLHERLAAARPATAAGPAPSPIPPSQPIVLTDEQKARIERNKQLALLRRQAVLVAATSNSDALTPAVSVPAERASSSSQEQQRATSNKRSREEGPDRTASADDEESVQPTPAELRSLREALFSGVVSSQNNVVPDKENASGGKENAVIENLSLGANKKHDFEDDFEEMDVDDVLLAPNTAEDRTENAPAAVPAADDEGNDVTVITSSRKSDSKTDRDQSNEESSADLPPIILSSTVDTPPNEDSSANLPPIIISSTVDTPPNEDSSADLPPIIISSTVETPPNEDSSADLLDITSSTVETQPDKKSCTDLPDLTPSSTVEAQPEEILGLDERKSVRRDGQETNFSGDVSEDLRSAVNEQANLGEELLSKKQIQKADEEDGGEHDNNEPSICRANDANSPEKVAVEGGENVGSSKLVEESTLVTSNQVHEIDCGDAINSLDEQNSKAVGLEMEAANISR